jgi:hypothetical protein
MDKINTLKKEFDNIKLLNSNICNIFDNLETKISKLKELYNGFLHENHNTLLVFGLDTFKFQNKLIDEEYEYLKNNYNLICNRIYCDYYNLYNIIIKFIMKNDSLEKIHKIAIKEKFEKYDYFNIYKYYNLQLSFDIFQDIINLVNALCDTSKSITNSIKNYNNKKKFGLNINNFIYTYAYKNSVLNEQINLYINYLGFFLRMHLKYFTNYIQKIKAMYIQINEDINFDKEDKKEYLTETETNMKTNNNNIDESQYNLILHSPTLNVDVDNNNFSSSSSSISDIKIMDVNFVIDNSNVDTIEISSNKLKIELDNN